MAGIDREGAVEQGVGTFMTREQHEAVQRAVEAGEYPVVATLFAKQADGSYGMTVSMLYPPAPMVGVGDHLVVVLPDENGDADKVSGLVIWRRFTYAPGAALVQIGYDPTVQPTYGDAVQA